MPEIYEGVLTPQDEFNLKLDSINRWNAVNIEPNFDVPESKILNDPLDPGEQVDIYSAMYSDNPEIRNMALIAQQRRIAKDTRVKLDPHFTIETPYSQAAKYLDQDYGFHPMADSEDFYAKQYEQRGKVSHFFENLIKFPARFGIGVGTKLGQTIGNIVGLFDPNRDHWMEGVSENAIAKFFYEAEQEWKDKFAPVFKPNGWEDRGFWSKFFDGRFWSDETADGLAFMGEMILSNYLLGAGLGKIGWVSKLAKWAPSGVGAIAKAQRGAMWLTGSKNLGELGSWGFNISVEALTEAAEGFKEKKRQLLADREKGLNNFSDEKINEIAGNVGSSRFTGNIFALAASQGIENRFIFNPLIRKMLRRTPEVKGRSNLVEVDEVGAARLKGSSGEKSKWYSKLNPVKGLRTPGSASRYFSGRLLTAYSIEGLWEENAQLAIDRLSMQDTLDFANFARQYGIQTKNAFIGNDPEASTSIGLGTVIGVIGGTIAGAGQRRNEMAQARLAMNDFNNARKNFLAMNDAIEYDEKGNPIYEDGILKFDPKKMVAMFQGMESTITKQMTADKMNDPVLANITYRSAIADYYRAARTAGIDQELITRLQSLASLSDEALKKLNLDPSSKKNVSSIINMIQRQKEIYDKVESLRKPDRPEGMSVQDYLIKEFSWRQLLYQQYSFRDIAKEAYESIKTRNADDILANTSFNESISDVAFNTFMKLAERKATLKYYYKAVTSEGSQDSNLAEYYKNTMNYLETEIDRIYDLLNAEGNDDYVIYLDKDEELKGQYTYMLSKTKNSEFFNNGTLKDDEESVKAIRSFIERQRDKIQHVASLENQYEQANFLISKLEDPEKGLITAFEYMEMRLNISQNIKPDPNNPEEEEETPETDETPEEEKEEGTEDPLMGFSVEAKDGSFVIKNPSGEYISSLLFDEEEAAINYINLNILPQMKKKEVKPEVIDYTNISQEELESGIKDALLTLYGAGYFKEQGITFSMFEDLYVHLPDILTNVPRYDDGEEILTKKEYSLISEFINRQNAKVGHGAGNSALADVESTALGDVTDKEYSDFVDNGLVSKERLNDIAGKVKSQQPLTEKETAIFTDKTSEINKIISEQPTVSESNPALADVESVANKNNSVLFVEKLFGIAKDRESKREEGVVFKTKVVSKVSSDGEVVTTKAKGEVEENGVVNNKRSVNPNNNWVNVNEFNSAIEPHIEKNPKLGYGSFDTWVIWNEMLSGENPPKEVQFKELREPTEQNTNKRSFVEVRVQYKNGEIGEFMFEVKPKSESLPTPVITSDDKIIFGHPGIGKTFLFEQGRKDIIDFDSEFKSRINEELGLPSGKDGWKYRNEWKKNNKELWNSKIRNLWEEAKIEAQRTGKTLLTSDIILLREFPEDFDKVITMSKDTFIQRAQQRNDYNPGEQGTEGWKNNLDAVINNIDKSKVIITDKYLSELLPNVKQEEPKKEPTPEEKINLTPEMLSEIENKPIDNKSFENTDFNC